jgi:hypothetical protein
MGRIQLSGSRGFQQGGDHGLGVPALECAVAPVVLQAGNAGSSTAAGHIQAAGLAVAQDEVSSITNGSVSASIVRVHVRHPRAVSRPRRWL